MSSKTVRIKVFGRYQVLDELGRGGMGVVYRGFDPVIGRTVAIKTIEFDSNDEEARQLKARLNREACAAGMLSHPNIVTIFDVVELDDTTAVVMEFIEGRDLAGLIAERAPLPLDEAIGIFEQLDSALAYAWGHGIVHRDIKPANILLAKDGRVKVADFGVARIADSKLTRAGTVVGSPDYMSPEQVRGHVLDGRSDVFSATVVLYEMLTNARPFGGDNLATTLYRIVHEPPRPFTATAGDAVSAVFERALAKDPDARYQSGGETATALRRALRGQAIVPGHAAPCAGKPVRGASGDRTDVIVTPPALAPMPTASGGRTVNVPAPLDSMPVPTPVPAPVPAAVPTPVPTAAPSARAASRTVAVAPDATPDATPVATPVATPAATPAATPVATLPPLAPNSSQRPGPRRTSLPLIAGSVVIVLVVASVAGWLAMRRDPSPSAAKEKQATGASAPGPPQTAAPPAAPPAAKPADAAAGGAGAVQPTAPRSSGAARPAPGARVYESNQVDVPPKVVSNPAAAYPPDARQRRLEDVVVLSVLVSETGRPVEIKILRKAQKAASFDTAAQAAVRNWTFKPAKHKGQTVRCWLNVAVPFQLRR